MTASLLARCATVATLGLIASAFSATLSTPAAAAYDVVPWGEVSPGWTFTSVTTGQTSKFGEQPRPRSATVSLVAPDGRRYALWSGSPAYRLADQRGTRTLQLKRTERTAFAVIRDHRSGGVTTVQLRNPSLAAVAFGPRASLWVTTPNAVTNYDDLRLRRASGTERLKARLVATSLPTPDRRQVVVTHARSTPRKPIPWRIVNSDNARVRQLKVARDCTPLRWVSASQVQASCALPGYRSRLGVVNLKNGAITWQVPVRKVNFADTDLRSVGGEKYVFTARDCAPGIVSKRNPDGTLTPVTIPGVTRENELSLLDASANELEFVMRLQCDGNTPRSSLFWFNPTINEVRTTYALAQNEVFQSLIPVGQQRPIGW